ncbi:oxidoreductase [soil metagenome]
MSRILITGCSSGFGLMAARFFGSRNERVFAGVRNINDERLAAVCDAFPTVTPLAIDVRSDFSVENAAALALADGPLDAVINNAGVLYRGAVEDVSQDELLRVFDTNLFGVLRVCKAVLPSMRSRRQGVIVNVGSLSGMAALPGEGIYAASKFALLGLSEAMAQEVSSFNVRLHVIEPGAFPTTDIDAKSHRLQSATPSPYTPILDRFWDRVSDAQRKNPVPDPALVIQAIARAVDDTSAPFSIAVGDDAVMIEEMRRKTKANDFYGDLHRFLDSDLALSPIR